MVSSKSAWTKIFLASGIVVAAVALGAAAVRRWHPSLSQTPASSEDVYNVDVFSPEHEDWSGLRSAVWALAENPRSGSPYKVIRESSDQISLRIEGGIARFTWHDTLGARDTEEEVYHLATSDASPAVVVGSGNTRLTMALANGLARANKQRQGGHGPILIIPWAASVDIPEELRPPRLLLDIYPGSSFRFCLNNRDAVRRAIRHLMPDGGPQAPVQVLIARYDEQDRDPLGTADPYAMDFSKQFNEEINLHVKNNYIVRDLMISRKRDDSGGGSGERTNELGDNELRWAQQVWDKATDWRKADGDRITWLVIPFQQDPTKRLIKALQARAPKFGPAPILQVLCGNGPSAASYAEIATARLPFPVWFLTSGYKKESDEAFASIIHAEVVAALVDGLERERRAGHRPTPEALRSFLVGLPRGSRHLAAAGRSVRFDGETREREGPDLGFLLNIRAGDVAIGGERQVSENKWEPVGPIILPNYD